MKKKTSYLLYALSKQMQTLLFKLSSSYQDIILKSPNNCKQMETMEVIEHETGKQSFVSRAEMKTYHFIQLQRITKYDLISPD